MKFLSRIFILFLFACLSIRCEDCTSYFYQIIEKRELINPAYCEYTLRARTSCAIWNEHDIRKFVDLCSEYYMSESMTKEYLNLTYPQ